MDSYRRKSPEELLESIDRLKRGLLTVYIGPVSGAGKTYHMLREGCARAAKGVDVVIGALAAPVWPETLEQIGSLEEISPLVWTENGTGMQDLDVDRIVERMPDLVLADGLAHRNRPGAPRPTRLEDIRLLISSGISVMTTVNVYELDGYKELAQRLTGVEVRCTVPDDTLELADEVRLIDVTPEALLSRMEEAKRRSGKDAPLLRQGNLGVLRELALRFVAEEVNESLRRYRRGMGLSGPSGAGEHILVSTQYHWNGSLYIRRGGQIAKRLGGALSVVTFQDPRKPLSKEGADFRRSMLKLSSKLGSSFEELPSPGRRRIADELVRYAYAHGVTRIIMGHSRQSRWEEWSKGSVLGTLLKKMRNVDLYLIADRESGDGSRIVTGASREGKRQEPHRRLTEDEVKEEIGKIARGRLKMFIGAAPGVGKTYAMLREGNDLLDKGIDVRVGLLETHGRPDTQAQLGRLPVIARAASEMKGALLQEMDVEAIIAARPEVVLVDELAHTNVPGSRSRKRYEDVQRILEEGISVLTTVNIQHLESLNDAVEQITGIRVRETVPDRLLRLADEIQLIDVSPRSLQQRMREGKIYAMNKVDQALNHFFRTGNLIALRELALRELADDVDERLESRSDSGSLRGPWRRKEVIFVCVSASPGAERLIRRGFRTAFRLKADWHVHYVRDGMDSRGDASRRVEELERLTMLLGGDFVVHEGRSPRETAAILVAEAGKAEATQLVIGQPSPSFSKEWRNGSLVRSLLRAARHLDVLIVADYEPGHAI
ncbi:histidine kinase [Paenibacillus humicus]|uniref:histidine kinase n=1 Tax=Paenibacillus humicus TaxID=412861 RepID=UPI000FD6C561|nr:histidine kinase [Paenibacillus humicus]